MLSLKRWNFCAEEDIKCTILKKVTLRGPDLTAILDQRDRDYCITALLSRRSISGDKTCGAGGR